MSISPSDADRRTPWSEFVQHRWEVKAEQADIFSIQPSVFKPEMTLTRLERALALLSAS
jgi:hypothetical protein